MPKNEGRKLAISTKFKTEKECNCNSINRKSIIDKIHRNNREKLSRNPSLDTSLDT